MSRNDDGTSRAEVTGVEYINGLYSYALVLTRNHAEAEGLVQESILSRMRAIEITNGQQHKGLALDHSERCLAEPIDMAAKWS